MSKKILWYARGGGVQRSGPYKTQAEATSMIRYHERLRKQLEMEFPSDAFVWPEEEETDEAEPIMGLATNEVVASIGGKLHVFHFEGSGSGTSRKFVCSSCNCGNELWLDWNNGARP